MYVSPEINRGNINEEPDFKRCKTFTFLNLFVNITFTFFSATHALDIKGHVGLSTNDSDNPLIAKKKKQQIKPKLRNNNNNKKEI